MHKRFVRLYSTYQNTVSRVHWPSIWGAASCAVAKQEQVAVVALAGVHPYLDLDEVF